MFIKLKVWLDGETVIMMFKKDSIIAIKPHFVDRSEITLVTGDRYIVYGKMNDIVYSLSPHYGDNPIKFGAYMDPFDPDKRI